MVATYVYTKYLKDSPRPSECEAKKLEGTDS